MVWRASRGVPGGYEHLWKEKSRKKKEDWRLQLMHVTLHDYAAGYHHELMMELYP